MTRRRWIADTCPHRPPLAALTGEQAAHLARVLRAQPGQVYDIVANGFLHRAEIATVSEDSKSSSPSTKNSKPTPRSPSTYCSPSSSSITSSGPSKKPPSSV